MGINAILTIQKLTIFVSLSVLVISLTQLAFLIDRAEDPNSYSNSFLLFLLGWMSFAGGAWIPFLFWLANPIYFIAIILLLKQNPKGILWSGMATLIALGFSQLTSIMTSELGTYSAITSLGLGYKLWVGSFLILTLGTGLSKFLLRKNFS